MKISKIINIILLTSYILAIFPTYSYSKMPNLFENANSKFINSDNEPKIYSKRALIYERSSKNILYGKNIDQICKMASTTKIMSSVVILKYANLNSNVTISKKAAKTGGSRLGLHTGDKVLVKDLLYGMLLCSGNDAAVALAEYTAGSEKKFVNLMNLTALEIGLTKTHFESPHGLDNPNHFTTIYELAKITDYALNIKALKKIVSTKKYTVYINGNPKQIHNTNELLGTKNVYGVKTGFTSKAGRCLVSAYKDSNLDIIVIVLGADTKSIRTSDSRKLIKYAVDNYKIVDAKSYATSVTLNEIAKYKNVLTINKSNSRFAKVRISNIKNTYYPVKKDTEVNFSFDHRIYKKNLTAPILKGTKLSYINIYCNGILIDTIYLSLDENIYAKGTIYYLNTFFINLKNILNNHLF